MSRFFQLRYRYLLENPSANCDEFRDFESKAFKWQKERFCAAEGKDCSCFPPTYSLVEFVREPIGGFEATCAFNARFFTHRDQLKQLYVLRYEDLKRQPHQEVEKLLLFLGVTTATNETIQRAVDKSAFEAYREKENNGEFGQFDKGMSILFFFFRLMFLFNIGNFRK